MTPGKRKVHAFQLFFPAAALYAALSVPLGLLAVHPLAGWFPGLRAVGHGHEMIFGFALALVAGYTLGPQPRRLLLLLLGLWLLARLSWALAPDSWAARLLSPTFTLILARYVVPRFQAAKKWRNKTAAPLILVICLIAPAFLIARELIRHTMPWQPEPQRLLLSAILGLLLLMAFIGGRLIAPAVAGTLEKAGITLRARVQPRVEGGLIVLLACAMALSLMGLPTPLVAMPLFAAAALLVVRLGRWRLWHCLERRDLLMLSLGYLWLAVSAAVTAGHLWTGRSVVPALHLITVGALGTLSTGVMLRLAWQRARRRFPPSWQVLLVGGLTSGAAVGRYLSGPAPFAEPEWLWLSASLWSLAYGLVFIQLLMLRQPPANARK